MLTGEDEVSEEESKGVDEIVSHNTGGFIVFFIFCWVFIIRSVSKSWYGKHFTMVK